jgi:hypothetical protein
LTSIPGDLLSYQKVIKLGTGASAGRQYLTLEVSFETAPPTLTVTVKDSGSPSVGEDAWVSASLDCTRSLPSLPTSLNAGGNNVDYSKAAGRYALYAAGGDSSGVNDAYVLAQLLPTGKLLWISRIKGSVGTGSAGLRFAKDGLNASVYEGRVHSASNLLKSASILGSLNFVWDSTVSSWNSNFGSDTLPGKVEKQSSYVSKTGGKFAFNDVQDATGITELDFSNRDGVRWGSATVRTVPEFMAGGGTLTSSVFTLGTQDPLADQRRNPVSYTWHISIAATGKVLATSLPDAEGVLSPKLVLTLDKQTGGFTGYYNSSISGKNVRCNIYGCGLMSQTDETLRARGWVETGVLPKISTGRWEMHLYH